MGIFPFPTRQKAATAIPHKATNMKSLRELTRPNIWALPPAPCHERPSHEGHTLLDANESPYNKPLNRYPDPLQKELKERLAPVKGVAPGQIFLGNGTDEAIDLCYRIFCEPRTDNVVAIEPTYTRYRHFAAVNDVEYRPVPLGEDYQLEADRLLSACDGHTKLVWLCSPNNPTGNLLRRDEVLKILGGFHGMVVIDEAYADFSRQKTFREELGSHPNLIVLNTFSNSWASAAIRLGMTFAHEDVIGLFNKAKYTHNISTLTQQKAIEAIDSRFDVDDWVRLILLERSKMLASFRQLPICEKVYPSDANFFLVRMTGAQAVCDYLAERGIIVADLSGTTLCQGCLRITIGTKSENVVLLGALRQYR